MDETTATTADPKLAFEIYFHHARDTNTWTNIALARAASGDSLGGAYMLEVPVPPMFEPLSAFRGARSRTRGARALRPLDPFREWAAQFSDAAALRLQNSTTTDDIQQVLKALVLADRALAIDPGLHEAHFNRGLALEKLGLWNAAVDAYRRSLDTHDTLGWTDETVDRMDHIYRPSVRELWKRGREKLELAGWYQDSSAIARIVRKFPQQSRIVAETEFLGKWAGSVDSGDVLAAERNLALARRVAIAVRKSCGDSLLEDAVRAIDEGSKLPHRRALSSLVRGHRLYELATASHGAASAIAFDDAGKQFDAAGSPMGDVARYSSIVARFDSRPLSDSLKDLRRIERHLNPSYFNFQALVDSEIATALAERGDVYEALERYERAQKGFEHMRDPASVAKMRVFRAHLLTLMGNAAEGWQVRRPALAEADRSGDPSLLELVLNETIFDERFERSEETARSLSNVLTRISLQYERPAFRISYTRSFAKQPPVQGEHHSVNDRALSSEAANELRFANGIRLSVSQPRQAEVLLSYCIQYSRATGRALMLPYVYLYRAIAREAENNEDAAIADLRRSISLLESRRRKITRIDLRDAWIRIADDVFCELFEIYWRRGDDRRAFASGEERRGLVFRDEAVGVDTSPLSPSTIASRLQPGVAMVVITSSNRHTLMTVIERNRIAMHRLEKPTGFWLMERNRLRTIIQDGHEREAIALAEDLYDSLIYPLGVRTAKVSKLVIVADRPLKDLPFSFLRDRRTGDYLLEQFELLQAPSASLFVQRAAPVPAGRPTTAVTLGEPAFDQRAYPALPTLPAAQAESMNVAQLYPNGRSLIGSQATLRNLAESISVADVVDIAAHTKRSSKEPLLLELLLAANAKGSGATSLRETSALPLKGGSTVVVAGCATAISREPGDLTNFAGSFLAAGASNVVGTLWDVDDDAACAFALRFHRSLSEGNSPSASVRAAQLSMLRSDDVQLRNAKGWSAYQVYTLSASNAQAPTAARRESPPNRTPAPSNFRLWSASTRN
ncbi:MAG TPA: CHAT domain-containing protein [Thermoanaerobaculia bacterium]|nr:CHAT domain-containing protein [Thermoanaerobaculia bacterium]